MAVIATTENPLRLDDLRFARASGRYIDWLCREYPAGFNGRYHKTLLNREELAVEDYDVELEDDDELILVITPNAAAIGAMVLQAIVTAVVGIAISYALNALFGPASISSNPSSLNTPAPSPVYSLNTPTNQARLGEPIPVVYGAVLATPDLASQPFSWFENNDMYLAIMLCLGQGYHTVHGLQVADSPANQLPEGVLDYQVFPPDSHNQAFGVIHSAMGWQFHENVDTSPEVADQELRPPTYRGARLTFTSGTTGTLSTAGVAQVGDTFQVASDSSGFIPPGSQVYTVTDVEPNGLDITFTPAYPNPEADPQSLDGTLLRHLFVTAGAVDPYDIQVTFFGLVPEIPVAVGDSVSMTARLSDSTTVAISGTLNSIGITQWIIGSTTLPVGLSVGLVYFAEVITSGTVTPEDDRGVTLDIRILQSWYDVGPFSVCAPGRTTQMIQVDIVLPNGLYELNQETGELRPAHVGITFTLQPVDSAGNADGDAITKSETIASDGDNTPQRRSFWWSVPSARYTVTAERTTGESGKATDQSRTVWTGLKSWLDTSGPVYGDVTLIAVKMKATNGLSTDVANRIGVSCTRKLDGVGTRSPVEAYKDIVTNTRYGANRPASELDTEAIARLAGHNFDAVYDFKSTVWEALANVCAVSHAAPIPLGAYFSAVVDAPKTTPTFAFTADNIVRDSLSVSWKFDNEGEPDGYEVEYRDPVNLGFQADYVRYPEDSVNPEKVVLFGCTEQAAAAVHAQRLWQRKLYRRKFISFSVELEGHLPQIGDLISVQHQLLNDVVETYLIGSVAANDKFMFTIEGYRYDARVYV